MLWAVLCFAVIRHFALEHLWYIVCSAILIIDIGLSVLHQKITFPGIIDHLGYEPNDALEEMRKFNLGDHAIKIVTMFLMVYVCLNV